MESLTARQNEILSLVAKGCSNVDIGEMLDISPNTVKAHISKILYRLDVSNRTEACMLLRSHQTLSSGLYDDVFEDKIASSLTESEPKLKITLWPTNVKEVSATEAQNVLTIAEKLSDLLAAWGVFKVYTALPEQTLRQREQGYHLNIDVDPQEEGSEVQITLKYHETDSCSGRLVANCLHNITSTARKTLYRHSVHLYEALIHDNAVNNEESNKTAAGCFFQAMHLFQCRSSKSQKKSLDLCELVLQIHPDWPKTHAVKAISNYQKVGFGRLSYSYYELQTVAHAANTAMSLESHCALSHLAFAKYSLLKSDFLLAQKHLETAVELNPCEQRAICLLGQVYAFTNNFDKNIKLFNDFLENFPDNNCSGFVYAYLAVSYYCIRDFEKSKVTARRAMMFPDIVGTTMELLFISLAELVDDEFEAKELIEEFKKNSKDENDKPLRRELGVAKRFFPSDHLDDFMDSLLRAGLDF